MPRRQGLIPPTIQVIFHAPLPRRMLEFAGLRLTRLERVQQSYPWGFTFDFDEQTEIDGSKVEFDPRLYDPAGVSQFIDRYQRLLDEVSCHPDKVLETAATSSARLVSR